MAVIEEVCVQRIFKNIICESIFAHIFSKTLHRRDGIFLLEIKKKKVSNKYITNIHSFFKTYSRIDLIDLYIGTIWFSIMPMLREKY
jgi:hypothetical protein